MVHFCNWCPVPDRPSPAHHPDGGPEHRLLKTWAEVAAGLRACGWVVEFSPLGNLPPFLWISPEGTGGAGYRSRHPESPPPAVMHAACKSGVIGFTHLAAS